MCYPLQIMTSALVMSEQECLIHERIILLIQILSVNHLIQFNKQVSMIHS